MNLIIVILLILIIAGLHTVTELLIDIKYLIYEISNILNTKSK